MSHQYGYVVSEILLRHFGEIVQKVGDDLFMYGCKPLSMIVKSTGLPRVKVIESLRTLLKYDLATFEPSHNDMHAVYKLLDANVFLLLRYPRYLLQIKSKFGTEAELLIEELLQQSITTATALLVTLAIKYKDEKEKKITIVKLKDMFTSLVTAGYIQQAPVAELKEGSEVPTLEPVATIVPDLDTRVLLQTMNSGNLADSNDNVYWRVNFDRFHLDFRDELMIKAVTRRIDENAGELMRLLLEQMYLNSSAWAPESNPIPAVDVRERCRRLAKEWPLLDHYCDQYLKVLEESGGGWVRGVEGGRFVVACAEAARALAADAVAATIAQRLGPRAARIYRVIASKKYIEEDDIQKQAMLANKECKGLTYKLLEEHFINIQPMRKAAGAGALAKAVYLYHTNTFEVCRVTRQLCVIGLRAALRVARKTRATHERLLAKRRRVRCVLHAMRERQDSPNAIHDVEEMITPPEHATLQSVERRLKQLSAAELALDKALFIFHLYFAYHHGS